jgi:hypothetical protein
MRMTEPRNAMTDQPPAGERTRARRLMDLAVEEFKQIAVVFLYLYVIYLIFNLYERMILAEHQINISIFGLAVINAFILAKVMIVAEHFSFARRFHEHPLVLPIVFKAVAFAALLILFHIVEGVVAGLLGGRGFVESIPAVGGGGIGGLAAVGAIMTVVLVPYFAYRELCRVLGERVLHQALFHRRPQAQGETQAQQRGGDVTNAEGRS